MQQGLDLRTEMMSQRESHRNAELGTWTFLVQTGLQTKARDAGGSVSTLSSMEDSRLVSWLSLATMLMGLASLGTWGIKMSTNEVWWTARGDGL